jgi:hypothetical protein
MKNKILYAYLAGILDGEGYVGIKKSTWGMKNRTDIKSPTFSERIQIKMNNPTVLKMFKDEFGGSFYKDSKIYQRERSYHTNKIMYCYQATDKIASVILKKLLPFLTIKRKQTILCLKLRKSKDSKEARLRGGPSKKRPMSKEVLDKRENFYQQILAIHSS